MDLCRPAWLWVCQGPGCDKVPLGAHGRGVFERRQEAETARHQPSPLDLVMKEWLDRYDVPHLVVATKGDKLSSSRLQKSVRDMKNILSCHVIPYSAATGMGKEQLWQVLKRV
jgi:hypothetical protein